MQNSNSIDLIKKPCLIKIIKPKYILWSFFAEKNKHSDEFQEFLVHIGSSKILFFNSQEILLGSVFLDFFSTIDLYYECGDEEGKVAETERIQHVLQIQSSSSAFLEKLDRLVQYRKTFIRVKGPLALDPCHKERGAILSSDNLKQHNFRGFLNLAALIVVFTNFRLALENILYQGLRAQFPGLSYFTDFRNWPCLTATMNLNIFVLIAYYIEKLAFQGKISSKKTLVLNSINIFVVIIFPSIFVYFLNPTTVPAIILFVLNTTLCMKLISFAHVNRNVRFLLQKMKELQDNHKNIVQFIGQNEISQYNLQIIKDNIETPLNLLSLRHLFYFIAVPTVCYQLWYPRTKSIRKFWLFKRFIELIMGSSLQYLLINQFYMPIVDAGLNKILRGDMLQSLEKILRLTIPTVYIWVLGFYTFFQVFLNITAELLRFADRNFYEDWWNCINLGEYWRLWNIPVHNWFVRHIYNPLLKRGYSKATAINAVFFISAVGHEYIASGSLGIISFYVFLIIMMQAPIIYVQTKTEKLFGKSQLGNVFFWITFCFICQPLGVLVYYYQAVHRKNPIIYK